MSAFSLLQIQRSLLYLYYMIINSITIVLCKNALIMKCMNEKRGHQNRKYIDYFLRQFIRAVSTFSKFYWYLYVAKYLPAR